MKFPKSTKNKPINFSLAFPNTPVSQKNASKGSKKTPLLHIDLANIPSTPTDSAKAMSSTVNE